MTATTTPPAVPAVRDVPALRVFARSCAAEWTRLRTVRGTWLFLGAAAVVMLGISLIAGLEAASQTEGGDIAWVAAQITTLPAQFALLALALIAVTADYATGGIVPALQWTPRRTLFFTARTLVAVVTATVAGVVLAALASLTAFVAAQGVLELPADEGFRVLGDVAFVIATGAALAAGLGFMLRSTAGGLVSVFLLNLVLPIMLGNLPFDWTREISERLPGTSAAFLLVGEVDEISTTTAVVTLLLWSGGALLLGWLRLTRTDANR
jgi:ABC-2 type transport system permease protein